MLDAIESSAGINLPFNDVGELISNILKGYVFYAAGLILLVYMVMGGLGMMMSQGEPKAFEGGKQKITNALIGFIIVFAAYWIVLVIGKILDSWQFTQVFGV